MCVFLSVYVQSQVQGCERDKTDKERVSEWESARSVMSFYSSKNEIMASEREQDREREAERARPTIA